jgi:hypothetical protein
MRFFGERGWEVREGGGKKRIIKSGNTKHD